MILLVESEQHPKRNYITYVQYIVCELLVSSVAMVRKRQPYILRIKHCRTLLAVTSGGAKYGVGGRGVVIYIYLHSFSFLRRFILMYMYITYMYDGSSSDPSYPYHSFQPPSPHRHVHHLFPYIRIAAFFILLSRPHMFVRLLTLSLGHSSSRIIGHKSNSEAPSFLLYPYTSVVS